MAAGPVRVGRLAFDFPIFQQETASIPNHLSDNVALVDGSEKPAVFTRQSVVTQNVNLSLGDAIVAVLKIIPANGRKCHVLDDVPADRPDTLHQELGATRVPHFQHDNVVLLYGSNEPQRLAEQDVLPVFESRQHALAGNHDRLEVIEEEDQEGQNSKEDA